jgi:4-hydroxybenzoate polyprenyltransferase
VFKKIFDFLIFSSLFVGICALAMVYQTYHLFHIPLFYPFFGFVFFGTLCSYNFHWYLTAPVQNSSVRLRWAISYKTLHLLLFLLAGIGAAAFAYKLRAYWFWLILSAFITFLYSAPKLPFAPFIQLRKIAIAKTFFLAFAWTHITTMLPLIITGAVWTKAQYLYILHRFFFLYPLCIVFDYRDREQDKTEGIKSLITMVSVEVIDIYFWGCVATSVIAAALLYFFYFPPSVLIALIVPVIALGLLYQPLKKNFSAYL